MDKKVEALQKEILGWKAARNCLRTEGKVSRHVDKIIRECQEKIQQLRQSS